jgi:uncharacterized 2Fe-2S/4Fe-4S cluster protein (DUF4445 family)
MAESETERCRLALMPSGRQGQVARGASLLEAARALGVEIESICGGRQTCGKCQVSVESGHFAKLGLTSSQDHLSAPGEVEAAYLNQHALDGRRLACAAAVQGDLLIVVPEESQARKQVVAKAATERVINVQPAVRPVYIELPAADLEDARGDWERLQEALAEQWGLHETAIDLAALRELQPALADPAARLKGGRRGLTVALWHDRQVLRVRPGYAEGLYGLAIDVGSTTLVAHLCDLRSGKRLATESGMNPQVRFGEDLMSRVSYAMTEPQGVERMHRAVVRTLNELAGRAVAAAGVALDDVLEAVIVGNPVMLHLVAGLDPSALGTAPFALAHAGALDLCARDLGLQLHPAARVHLLPGIAGHVGADHVAALLAEGPHRQDEIMLVIDVGTNAEISLGDRQGLLCASSPTGPAFEGAQITHGQRAAPGAIERVRIDRATLAPRYRVIGWEPWIGPDDPAPLPEPARATGICGSGIIEAVVELLAAGVIAPDGRFQPQAAAASARVRFPTRAGEYLLVEAAHSATGQDIVITQADVRAIQLAKAALYAGVRLLMAARGVGRVDRIALAGAFGSLLDPAYVMALGMIPDCELGRVYAAGNAAGDGARIALLDHERRQEAVWLAGWARHVQTATEADFQNQFVDAMALPHASDRFPQLEAGAPHLSLHRGEHERGT